MSTDIVHHKMKVQRTAHIYTYGNRSTAKISVLVCHGYAQLAERIIRKFDHMSSDDIYVIAPEALNVFYWQGVTGDPVASWMTKRHRGDEIIDFSFYLNQVYQDYLAGFEGKIIVMGFSQGCATLWRWMHNYPHRIDHIINWAGWIPEDINLSTSLDHLPQIKIDVVVGDEDEYLTEDRKMEMQFIVNKNRLPVKYHEFRGRHAIDRNMLKQLVDNQINK